MKRSNRYTLALLVGGGVVAFAAAGVLARTSGATVADTTCPADVLATLTNASQPTVTVGVAAVRGFTLLGSYAVSAVHLSAPDGYNATQVEEPNDAYGLQLTAPRAGAFTVQATWSEAYMIDNPDGTNSPATCSGAGSVTLTAIRPPAPVPPNKLPAPGIWLYDIPPGSTLPAIANYATVQAYLNVSPGRYAIYSFAVIVVKGGTCTKDGRTDPSMLVSGTSAKTLIAVKPDGSFSATRNAVSDESGSKGTVQLKGVFNGVHLKGTATVHMHYPVFGDCRATGKFASKGVRIG